MAATKKRAAKKAAPKKAAKKRAGKKSSKKSGGQIPLKLLEKRASELNSIVKDRGGTIKLGAQKLVVAAK